MIRLTETHLALAARCVPPALAGVGVAGAMKFPGTIFGLACFAAILVGAYAHGKLTEQVRRGYRVRAEDGPSIQLSRKTALGLAGYRHVSLPMAATAEEAQRLDQAFSSPVGSMTTSWCPCCHAIYAPSAGFEEHHRPDCPRARALDELDAALGNE